MRRAQPSSSAADEGRQTKMRRRLGVPMVSSNLACAYAACAALQLKPSVAMQDCAPELAELLR